MFSENQPCPDDSNAYHKLIFKATMKLRLAVSSACGRLHQASSCPPCHEGGELPENSVMLLAPVTAHREVKEEAELSTNSNIQIYLCKDVSLGNIFNRIK